MDTYQIRKLKSWLESINGANNALADIGNEYSGSIDYEDEAGETEFTSSDMDNLFHLLCKLEDALESEIKYYETEQ